MAKTWLVTGSSRGIGAALARAALEYGNTVVAGARDESDLADLAGEFGDRVTPVVLDVTDEDESRVAVDTAIDRYGRLDVVANVAGYANSAAFEETGTDDFRAQIETNLFGVVNVTRAALPHLRRQRSGHFLQFSSIGGRVGGTPGLSAYQAAKFAVEGFSDVLHAETAPFGVHVTIVEPGSFRTDWSGSSMGIVEPGPDYESTVGEMISYRNRPPEDLRGDPARAATILVKISELDDPPLRLLLGPEAVMLAEESEEKRAEETRVWADVSMATDYGSPVDLEYTPITELLNPPGGQT